jgi:putative GTP pyrophosphokinase
LLLEKLLTKDKIKQPDRAWLEEILKKHDRLAPAVHSLLENMLEKEKIEYLSITHRVKSVEGAIEKIQRKSYGDPKRQLTDLSGIRVITYLADLGHDRIGYRSTHFVCTLGEKRDVLPEWESLGNQPFEIQVRTVLQHSWAELAHDRSFKFGAALPTKIQRKLNLYSGMLEIVDSAFDQISREIDEYSATLDKINAVQIKETEIDSISVTKFVRDITAEKDIKLRDTRAEPEAIEELKKYGIRTIGDFKTLITKEFIAAYMENIVDARSMIGFIRLVLMFSDIERYLETDPSWGGLSQSSFDVLSSKYGAAKVKKIMIKHKRDIENIATLPSSGQRRKSSSNRAK